MIDGGWKWERCLLFLFEFEFELGVGDGGLVGCEFEVFGGGIETER